MIVKCCDFCWVYKRKVERVEEYYVIFFEVIV